MDKSMCKLFIGAFFFAMLSCEYLKVSGHQKTKLLCIRNIRFFRGKCLILRSDKSLHSADSISITFEQQKRDLSNKIITHHQTKDKIRCPVKIWCKIVCHIIPYPSIKSDTTVNAFLRPDSKLHYFSGTELLKWLRLAMKASAGVQVFMIILLGQWSSDAFLRYIRKQVKEFSTGVSQKMIVHEDFYLVPLSSSDSSNVALKIAPKNKKWHLLQRRN